MAWHVAPLDTDAPLSTTLKRVMALYPYYALTLGQAPGGPWLPPRGVFSAETPILEQALDRLRLTYGIRERDVQVSFLFANYAWIVVGTSLGCYILDQRVPDLSLDNVLVALGADGYIKALCYREGGFTALPDDSATEHADVLGVANIEGLRTAFLTQLDAHIAEIIDLLEPRVPLSRRFLWNTVADQVANACVVYAKKIGRPDLCEPEVDALLRRTASPSGRGEWRKSQTGIQTVEAGGRREPFLKRGACCLAYKVPAYGYCATCPLLDEAERETRLRAMMASSGHRE